MYCKMGGRMDNIGSVDQGCAMTLAASSSQKKRNICNRGEIWRLVRRCGVLPIVA